MPESSSYRWYVLAAGVLVVMGAIGFGRFGYTMLLPEMQTGLGLSTSQAGDLAAANMVGYLLLAIACGFLASHFGPRIVILISLLAVTASLALTGAAGSYKAALLLRFLTGAGGGGVNVPVMGLMAAWFASERRGLAGGILVSGSSFAMLTTGVLIPWVLSRGGTAGWRVSWYVLASITAVIFVIAFFILRDQPSPRGAAADTSHEHLGWRDVTGSRDVWLLSGIYTTFGFSYIIYATFFAKTLMVEGGWSAVSAGRLWSAVGAVSIGSGLFWGMVSDRIGRKYAMAIVYFLKTASYVLFALSKSPAGYYLSAAFFAVAAFSIPAIMSAAAGDLLGPKMASAAFGIITLFFGIGQVAGPIVAGRMAESTGTFSAAFLTAASAAFIGGLLSILLLPSRMVAKASPLKETPK